MTPVFIYTLNDPVTGIVRYCGQTVGPDVRLAKHIRNARKEKYHCPRWVKSLLSKKLRPIMEIIDVVPDDEADFWEREYIQNFRERGFDLTNVTPGGEGVGSGEKHPLFGKKRSPGTCKKISDSKKAANLTGEKCHMFGKKLSQETLEKRRTANLGEKNPNFGKTASLETRAKISAANKGKKITPEQSAARSARRLGIKKTPEHRAALSAGWTRRKGEPTAARGIKKSPETCAKMSAAAKIRKHKRNEGGRFV